MIEAGIAVFKEKATSEALAGRIGLDDADPVAGAAEVAVPLLVEAMRDQVAEPRGRRRLAQVVGRVDPAGLADPAAVFAAGRHTPDGLRLVDHLFDDLDTRSRVARTVTDRSGLQPGSGSDVLAAAAWVVGAQLHRDVGSPVDGGALAAVVDGGSRRALPPAPASALAPLVSGPDDPVGGAFPAPRTPIPAPPTRFEPSPAPAAELPVPVVRAAPLAVRPGSPVAVPTVDEVAPTEGAPAPATRRTTNGGPVRSARSVRPGDDVAVGSSRLVTGLAAALGLLVVGIGLWWWLDGRGDEAATSASLTETTQADDGAAAPAATPGSVAAADGAEGATADGTATAGAAEEGTDGSGDAATPVAESSDAIGPDGRASIDAAMLDPVGRSSATGTAGLRFDAPAGQICYEIELDGMASPADGHIHLGPPGVKGGIVVDFGPMESGASDCLPVPGSEIEAILADPGGHYVELHDPSEDFTIRAQLSEGTGPDGRPVGSGGDDPADAAGSQDVLFDPDGGGAVAIIEPGRIVLRGEVVDRAAAERVLVDFAGLTDVVVIDELTLVDGAPLPSGRVVIDSPELFPSDSDVLDEGAAELVDQLIALVGARPDWRITVVGHTDSTGSEVYNLELSLRRAEAVRQELIDGGVEPDRVRVRGAGSTDPLTDNATLAGRAQNRRIEFEIER